MNYQTIQGVRVLAGDIYRTLLSRVVSLEDVKSFGDGNKGDGKFLANLRTFSIEEAKRFVADVEGSYGPAAEDEIAGLEFGREAELPIIDSEFGSMPGEVGGV